MNAERFLRQLKSCDTMIQRGIERIRELEYALLPSGISYDGIRVQTTKKDAMTEGMVRIASEIEKLQRIIAKDSERKREVEAVVKKLDPVKMEIAYYRYRDGMTITGIADKINYSYSQTYRLWKQLLKEVEVMISEQMEGEEDHGGGSGIPFDARDDLYSMFDDGEC